MFRRGLFYSFLSIYLRQYLGMSMTETTLFATVPMIVNVSFQTLVWGRVSDALQLRRTLIVIAEILASAGTLALWYVHTLPAGKREAGYVIIAGLSVIEVVWSMSNVAWSALISDLYRREDRIAVQGQLASIGAIGRIVGVWIGGALYDGLGLQYQGWGFQDGALFFVASGAMLLSTIPMFFLSEGGVEARADEGTAVGDGAPAGSGKLFVVFLAAMVFTNFGRNSVAVIYGPYLSLESGFALSSKALSHVINARSVAMVVSGVLIGRLGSRLGNGKALMAGTVGAIASLVVLAFADRLWLVCVSSVLAGCADVVIMSSAYALASALIPPLKRGRSFSLYNATMFLSWGLAGTLIAGPIIDALIARGSAEMFAYQMAFVAAAAITLVGLIVQGYLTMLRRTQ